MTLFFDATPLIYLAKTGKLHLLEMVDTELIELIIPRSVFEEVVIKGKELGKPDALIIERLVDEGVFQIEDADKSDFYNKLKENENLSQADVEVLALASRGGTAIMDEDYARKIAEAEDIRCRGTIHLIFLLLKRGVITKEDTRETVDRMIENGWYCSTDLYAKILRRIGD